jgi:hypothetical protein
MVYGHVVRYYFVHLQAALTPVGAEPTLGTCFVAGGAAGFGKYTHYHLVTPRPITKQPVQSQRVRGSLLHLCLQHWDSYLATKSAVRAARI